MEIAFFTSLAGIIIFLAYKLVTTKQSEVELQARADSSGTHRYDPVDHVFTVGAVVVDVTADTVRYVIVKSVTIYRSVVANRKRAEERERDESMQKKGAASFYIKNIQERKKTLRKEGNESF